MWSIFPTESLKRSVYVSGITGARIDRNMRMVLLNKISHLPMSYFRDENPRDEVYRMVSVVSRIFTYDWTSTDIVNYFTEAGVFTNEDWVYVQDHPTYYAGTAVHECAGYMDEEGLVMICVFNTDPNNGETLDVDAFLQGVRDTHALPEDLSSLPVDHMVGDLIFFYRFTADETVYNAFDAAYEQLVAALGVTPDF